MLRRCFAGQRLENTAAICRSNPRNIGDLAVAEIRTAITLPTSTKASEESLGQIDTLGPTALIEYTLDFCQRSVLFLDILRQRGHEREEMLARGVSSVLIYESELVMRGDALLR